MKTKKISPIENFIERIGKNTFKIGKMKISLNEYIQIEAELEKILKNKKVY